MKKFFALAATAGLVLSLAACGGGSDNKTDAVTLNETTTLNEGAGGNDTIVDDRIGNATENGTDANATSAEGNAL